MKINYNSNSVNFCRKLKPSEEKEYANVLQKGRELVSHSNNPNTQLIIPSYSLPQQNHCSTGTGNVASNDARVFFEFVKKYWGINEIQLLPVGQFHKSDNEYPIYSSSSMDLGTQMINLEDYLSKEEFEKIVKANHDNSRVNFANIISKNSQTEKSLYRLFKNMPPNLKTEFEKYNSEYIEKKALYKALSELNNSKNYNKWNKLDKNLFNEDIVSIQERNNRISEIKQLKLETIEFFKFKNFLAEKSLAKAKNYLNSQGIKLKGDLILNFSSDEVWANPKAFLKDYKIAEWGLPVLDIKSPESEKVLREKVRIYANRFDGFRVDASWAYMTPNIKNIKTNSEFKLDNGTRFLDIIDDEVKNAKGIDFDLKNINHEFAANSKTQFNIYSFDRQLKDCVRNRVKIYTSDFLSSDWGSADSFIKRSWGEDYFIVGNTNHDSQLMTPSEEHINALHKILKIPKEKLRNKIEFIKAKFAEPLRAKNNMLFFMPALGSEEKFYYNADKSLNYTYKISQNYENEYFDGLNKGRGYNPMDALEKQFIAQGLDKKEPELFKKIIKFKKILIQKEGNSLVRKFSIGIAFTGLCILCLSRLLKNYSSSK